MPWTDVATFLSRDLQLSPDRNITTLDQLFRIAKHFGTSARAAALRLIDKERVGETSAKLDALMINLEDVLAEGHKALVFSQFTSMLAIVKKRLDETGTPYEYLDGKTRGRGS